MVHEVPGPRAQIRRMPSQIAIATGLGTNFEKMRCTSVNGEHVATGRLQALMNDDQPTAVLALIDGC